MIKYINNSDTVVIVLHEIYGINEHIVNVCEKLSKFEVDIIAPNMLNCSEAFDYAQEDNAYNHFMNHIGFESAFNQVKQILCRIRNRYERIFIIGYSIGATVAWLCSETDLCDLVIGFYGSRIRSYNTIVPKCPVLLFFPTQEKTFNVDELISILSKKDNIKIKKIWGQHGFANPFSQHYNKESSIKACRKILSFVSKLENIRLSKRVKDD